MIMTISHHHTSKWKENKSTKPVIRRLPIRSLVELVPLQRKQLVFGSQQCHKLFAFRFTSPLQVDSS